MRIISLVPSLTELLADLGLEEEVVGITKFCVHPDHWFHSKPRVGGTKNVKLELVRQLKPDLIIANKEENDRRQVEALQSDHQVCLTDIRNLPDALSAIAVIGERVHKKEASLSMIEKIKQKFDASPSLCKRGSNLQTAYLIWQKPYMAAGGDTFIGDMLRRCGLRNIFEDIERYPETGTRQLLEKNCELLLLSSEPFPFTQKHADAWQAALPDTRISLVDGEMFSWYGSRLIYATDYFRGLTF
jgi:ABC-type Fe3+-hydroxamate transport system substrate-binding protein